MGDNPKQIDVHHNTSNLIGKLRTMMVDAQRVGDAAHLLTTVPSNDPAFGDKVAEVKGVLEATNAEQGQRLIDSRQLIEQLGNGLATFQGDLERIQNALDDIRFATSKLIAGVSALDIDLVTQMTKLAQQIIDDATRILIPVVLEDVLESAYFIGNTVTEAEMRQRIMNKCPEANPPITVLDLADNRWLQSGLVDFSSRTIYRISASQWYRIVSALTIPVVTILGGWVLTLLRVTKNPSDIQLTYLAVTVGGLIHIIIDFGKERQAGTFNVLLARSVVAWLHFYQIRMISWVMFLILGTLSIYLMVAPPDPTLGALGTAFLLGYAIDSAGDLVLKRFIPKLPTLGK